jgi:hypothetical protein
MVYLKCGQAGAKETSIFQGNRLRPAGFKAKAAACLAWKSAVPLTV